MGDEWNWTWDSDNEKYADFTKYFEEYINDLNQQDLYTAAIEGPNNITLKSGDSEMLRVAPEGFYVRGVLVPADEREAKIVYDAFKQWLTWATLNKND